MPKIRLRIPLRFGQWLKTQDVKRLTVDAIARLVILARKHIGIVQRLPIAAAVEARIQLRDLDAEKRSLKPKSERAKTRLRRDFANGILPDPRTLRHQATGLSQHNENSILVEIFAQFDLPAKDRVSVELGAGHQGGNSGVLTLDHGFKSLWIDADPLLCDIARASFANCELVVENYWLTADNCIPFLLLKGFGTPSYVGIDVDGVDYWIFIQVLRLKPLVVCVEYNPVFGPTARIALRKDDSFSRRAVDGQGKRMIPKGIHGASIQALCDQARIGGYRLVAASSPGSNLFFVRNELLPAMPSLAPVDVFVEPRKLNLRKVVQQQRTIGFDNWVSVNSKFLITIPHLVTEGPEGDRCLDAGFE